MFMPHPYAGRRRPGGRGGLGLVLLAAQIHRMGLHNIPTLTLGLMGANIAAYLDLVPILAHGAWRVCLSYHHVMYYREYSRMLLSAFYHADDWHLLYNMSSLMWKGYNLERAMGIVRFATMMLIFLAATPLIHLGIVHAAVVAGTSNAADLAHTCSVGFSGILFAMKVVATVDSVNMHDVFYGTFSVQGKYVVWAELLLIHFIHPGSSFLGHLSGILAGFLYVRGFMSPLVAVLETAVDGIVSAVTGAAQQYNNGTGYGYGGGGYEGYAEDPSAPPPYRGAGDDRDDMARRQAAEAARRRFS